MSSDNAAVKVESISKCFEMYEKPVHRLFQTLLAGRKQFFKEFWALKNVSFEIERGECCGIIGQNGAGKSTLLQIITGTLSPTTGSVQARGRVAALLELGSGFNPEFTGRENIYMNGTVLGLSRAEITAKYQDIVDFADIGEFIDQPVKTYSSGMVVRLAFAINAFVDADILIVDEALAVGDAAFQQKCMRHLREFMKTHTVLFVSHNIGAVKSLCNKAIYLKNGQVRMIGSAKEVADLYHKDIYAKRQGVEAVSEPSASETGPDETEETDLWRDMRQDFINRTNLRNDLEIFRFDEEAKCFGPRQIEVVSVKFTDAAGRPLSWIVGGEVVTLQVKCVVHKDVYSPIVGFYVNDKLGQKLFGDNTYLTYEDKPLEVGAGGHFQAEFTFTMPILPRGNYSVTLGIAEGTQEEHIQHQWIYEAILFESHASSIAVGLAGIPMRNMKLIKL